MTEMIRDVMSIEYKGYKYLGNGVISHKRGGKARLISFNSVYNTLVEYGVDDRPSKVKATLNKIHDYKNSKQG
tara:strand:+ start:367 stop:585 length:219 start_codon:yes stop_codon:yes gene_type:complete